jgi:uncharacterized phage-like protein YoqJ
MKYTIYYNFYGGNTINVSVIIPCIPKHIPYLNDVLQNMKDQTLKPYEIIITLSETKKEDAKKLKIELKDKFDLNLKIISHEEKQNSAENKNRGVEYVDKICEYIAFIDADDITYPTKLKDMTDFMLSHDAELGLHSYSQGYNHKNKSLDPNEMKEYAVNNKLEGHYYIPSLGISHGHIIIKKYIFDNITFDPTCNYCEDSDFIRKILDYNYKGVFLNKPLILYRSELSNKKI